jgi:hypothetical protein
VRRTDWEHLPGEIRAAIVRHTGPITAARTASAGRNSALAALLETPTGTVFVKGLPADHPAQVRETVINPYVGLVSPKLLWHAQVDGWRLLGFAHAPGRHANYTPGSTDLPKVVEAMRRLGQLPCPNLPQLQRAEQRWAEHIDHVPDRALLRGERLLHTDYSPDNLLVDGPVARLIDWAWPTRGAGFIDPACLIVRLVFAGHTPAQAEATVTPVPAWHAAPARAVNVFASALATMWTQIADHDPSQWKQQMADAALAWAMFRSRLEQAT